VLVGLLAPRPIALTALRMVAVDFFALALAGAAADGVAVADVVAVGVTGTAAVLSAMPAIALAAANGIAYGDERRYPLKTPPMLLVGPAVPAPLLVGAGIATGPLLIAADRPIAGAVAVVVGIPLAIVMARALHGLSRRWVVLVPAGLVVVDPLTLPDPVLFLRERIVSLREPDPRTDIDPDNVVDLRMGALADSLALTLDRDVDFLHIRRGRREIAPAEGKEVWFATVRSRQLLADAAGRRIPVLG